MRRPNYPERNETRLQGLWKIRKQGGDYVKIEIEISDETIALANKYMKEARANNMDAAIKGVQLMRAMEDDINKQVEEKLDELIPVRMGNEKF